MSAIAAWNALVAAREARRSAEVPPESREGRDRWVARAPDYDRRVRAHVFRDDLVWDFLRSILPPRATVLDIGAGTGRWAAPLAEVAAQVTALEPSASMRERLGAGLAERGICNVAVHPGEWPEAEVSAHDVSICMHAMYGARDFQRWIERTNEVTRGTCIWYLRDPTPDDPLGLVSQAVWGHPHVVPDCGMALAALAEMGIPPGILRVPPGVHPARRHASMEEAIAWARQRMRLPEEHLPLLEQTLRERLRDCGGHVEWPDTQPATLLHWG